MKKEMGKRRICALAVTDLKIAFSQFALRSGVSLRVFESLLRARSKQQNVDGIPIQSLISFLALIASTFDENLLSGGVSVALCESRI